jgi:hypothetical protein
MLAEADLVADNPADVLQSLEAMTMRALLLQCSDQPLHHPVLLRGMRSDELLPQAVATNQGGVAARGEDQAVVRAKKEGLRDSSKSAEASNQRLLQSGLRSLRTATARQMSTQELAAVTVHHERLCGPAFPTTPDSTQVRCPTFIQYRSH